MKTWTIEHSLKAAGAVAGTGNAVQGQWVDTRDLAEGHLFIDVTAIDADTTVSFTLDFANLDKSIVGDSGVTVSNMTTVSQQMKAVAQLAAFVRLSYTVTNAKNATFRAVLTAKTGK